MSVGARAVQQLPLAQAFSPQYSEQWCLPERHVARRIVNVVPVCDLQSRVVTRQRYRRCEVQRI